jgi:hypothetical protein
MLQEFSLDSSGQITTNCPKVVDIAKNWCDGRLVRPARRLPTHRLRLLIHFLAHYPFGAATIATARALFPATLRAALRRALRSAR